MAGEDIATTPSMYKQYIFNNDRIQSLCNLCVLASSLQLINVCPPSIRYFDNSLINWILILVLHKKFSLVWWTVISCLTITSALGCCFCILPACSWSFIDLFSYPSKPTVDKVRSLWNLFINFIISSYFFTNFIMNDFISILVFISACRSIFLLLFTFLCFSYFPYLRITLTICTFISFSLLPSYFTVAVE